MKKGDVFWRSIFNGDDVKTQQAMKLNIRPPSLNDGAAIARLVSQSKTLDVNSTYLYFLLADHFASTCAVAELGDEVVGFVTAYRLPDQPDVLFVWQIAIAANMQGKGLALALLESLTQRNWFADIKAVQCTISPSNEPSNALFAKWARHLGAQLCVEPYLTTQQLGAGHEAELLVVLDMSALTTNK